MGPARRSNIEQKLDTLAKRQEVATRTSSCSSTGDLVKERIEDSDMTDYTDKEATPNTPLMNDEERELMDKVEYVSPTDEVNNSDDEILLIDVTVKDEAIEMAEAWVALVSTLDGDNIEIGKEPATEYVDSSVIDEFDRAEIRLIRDEE